MAGSTVRVVNAETSKPPTTARPRGADCDPLSPRPIAIGIIPQIIAVAVIRMARNRPTAPAREAAVTSVDSCRCCSANVIRRIEFATEMPTAMMAPINDWMLSVVPVSNSINITPARTPGTTDSTARGRRTD